MKRMLIIIGVVLIIAGVGWKLGISPRAEIRLSLD